MTEISKLVELKKKLKRKKPNFIREGSQNRVRIGKKWRKPRGLQSKMRHEFAGHRQKVKVGFGSPDLIRGFDKEGFKLINIETFAELEKLNPKIHKIIINSKLGNKKRILLLEKSVEKGFKVYGRKDPSKMIEVLKNKFKKKKDDKLKKVKVKKDKKDSKVKQKAELEEKVSAEDKKKKDQKEMEKIITQR